MSNFVPKKQHLREVLLHYFLLKKSAAETHRLLVEAYGKHAPSNTTCRDWFRRFKDGDFEVGDKKREDGPKKFKDAELESLLDEDPCQTEKLLAEQLNVDRSTIGKRLHALGFVSKFGNWGPHELKERNIDSNI